MQGGPLTFMTCVAGTPACVEVIPGSALPIIIYRASEQLPTSARSPVEAEILVNRPRPDPRAGRSCLRAGAASG